MPIHIYVDAWYVVFVHHGGPCTQAHCSFDRALMAVSPVTTEHAKAFRELNTMPHPHCVFASVHRITGAEFEMPNKHARSSLIRRPALPRGTTTTEVDKAS